MGKKAIGWRSGCAFIFLIALFFSALGQSRRDIAARRATATPRLSVSRAPAATPTQFVTQTRPPIRTAVRTPALTVNSTRAATNTPQPRSTSTPEGITYYTQSNANARTCPQVDCIVLTVILSGTAVQVIDEVEGQRTVGSAVWYIVRYDSKEMYVHSSLLAQSSPAAQQVQSTARSSPAAQPTQPPAAQSVQEWNCIGDRYNCSDFSNCAEVMSYFNACPGDPSRLDRNNDGIPCESLC